VATFCKKIQKFQSEAPITIHCSAGVGRTGTIILIDTCLRMANAEGLVDPFHVLAAMREQRLNLVDNEVGEVFLVRLTKLTNSKLSKNFQSNKPTKKYLNSQH